MTAANMTNEQFALWIASQHARSFEVIEFADRYYKWLEDKKPKQAPIRYYNNGVEVPESYWDTIDEMERRMDMIGQNGNEGTHYYNNQNEG